MIISPTRIMSFTNLTPDVNPDGSRFPVGTQGIRYFYFSFVPTTSPVNVFLTRNIYRNEESITRIFTAQSPINLLTQQNVSNISYPCVFINGQITINSPSGLTYRNTTNIPNFKINLVIGNTYILESRTIYNDPGTDFGAYMSGTSLTYIQNSTVPITPILPKPMPLPVPPPPAPPPPTGLPSTPNGLVASSAICGVSLSWNPVQSTRYLIYREGLLISSSDTPNYMDPQVISGNPYTYAVSALNLVGESTKSLPTTITPSFLFTCLIPNRTPIGAVIGDSNIRYYYFLFTPITPTIDVFCYNGTSSTKKAIVGIYDTTDISTNYFVNSNLTNLDSNVTFGSQVLGSTTIDGLSVIPYTNTGTLNFTINLPVSDLTTPAANLKTYILEIVAYTPDTFTSDFGVYFKSTQLNYNSVSLTREIPSPYVIAYDFSGTSQANYTSYIYPSIAVFQNVKNVLESIIVSSPNARGMRRTNDMLVHFTIAALTGDILGESSLDKWTVDTRSPDFTYEQSITFNSKYFISGYMTKQANFNGATTVNKQKNTTLFNVLLHEMMHGLGFFYTSSYNTSSVNVGLAPFLTDIGTTPWYQGPPGSAALSSYKTYSNSNVQRIPVEGNYGPGTALSHWDDGMAPNIPNNMRYFNGTYTPAPTHELMTGFLSGNEYMTGLTAGFLKDYGYNVNLVCAYVVAHPPFNTMPAPSSIKCISITTASKIINTIIVEDNPSLFHYLQVFGYYMPVYYG